MHSFGEENLMYNPQEILLKKCNQLGIREVIKKFVDWCDEILTYRLSFANNFCREYKRTNILLVVTLSAKYV